jgi:hypothetical protein
VNSLPSLSASPVRAFEFETFVVRKCKERGWCILSSDEGGNKLNGARGD